MDVHKRLAGKASGVHLHADKKLKYAICRFMWWFVSTCQDWCCCACVHNSRWHYAISRLALLLSGDLQRFMSLLSKKIEHRRGRNPRRKHTLPALQNDIYGQDDRELELVLHPLSSPNWVCSAILCRMTWLFGAIGMCPVGIVLRGCVFSGSLIWFCVHFGRTIPAIVCRTFDQMKDGCMSLWHWYACTVKISWGEWAALPTHLWSMAAEHGPPCKPRAGVASTNLPTRHRTDGVWS